VQPFLSGAISKTVNLPADATVEDVMEVYTAAWKLGIKAVAIYRDGSKRVQPLSASSDKGKQQANATAGKAHPGASATATPPTAQAAASALETKGAAKSGNRPSSADTSASVSRKPARRKLNETREAITHKFSIAGHEGYITAGKYADGQPGEIFIVMAKEGSTVSGLMDSFATAISLALQYGVPLKVLVDKFSHTRFEPSGWTGNKDIPFAKSIMDYIFRWLAIQFIPGYQPNEGSVAGEVGVSSEDVSTAASANGPEVQDLEPPSPSLPYASTMTDAPSCADCGSIMTRNGSCYKCENCGSTSGCS